MIGLTTYVNQADLSLDRAENQNQLRFFYAYNEIPHPSDVARTLTPVEYREPITPRSGELWKFEYMNVHCVPNQIIGWHLRGQIRIHIDLCRFILQGLADFAYHIEESEPWNADFRADTRYRLTCAYLLLERSAPLWGAIGANVEHLNQARHRAHLLRPLNELAPPNWLEHGPGST